MKENNKATNQFLTTGSKSRMVQVFLTVEGDHMRQPHLNSPASARKMKPPPRKSAQVFPVSLKSVTQLSIKILQHERPAAYSAQQSYRPRHPAAFTCTKRHACTRPLQHSSASTARSSDGFSVSLNHGSAELAVLMLSEVIDGLVDAVNILEAQHLIKDELVGTIQGAVSSIFSSRLALLKGPGSANTRVIELLIIVARQGEKVSLGMSEGTAVAALAPPTKVELADLGALCM